MFACFSIDSWVAGSARRSHIARMAFADGSIDDIPVHTEHFTLGTEEAAETFTHIYEQESVNWIEANSSNL